MERVLVKLIQIYRLNNGIGGENEVNKYTPISLYIQQLFYNVVQGFKKRMETQYAHIIRSEYDTLIDALKSELFHFKDANIGDSHLSHSQLILSPFLGTLCKERNIIFMEEYIWMIHEDLFSEIQNAAPNQEMYSEDEYVYKQRESVSFRLGICRKSDGSDRVGLTIRICESSKEKTHTTVSLSVAMSSGGIWNANRWSFYNMGKATRQGRWAFDDEVLDEINSLTIRFAILFW